MSFWPPWLLQQLHTHPIHLGSTTLPATRDPSAGQESLQSETDVGLVRSSRLCPSLPPGFTLTFLVQWCSHLVKVSPRRRCDSLHWPHPEANLTLGSSDFPTHCQTQGFPGRRENWPMAAITHWTPLSSLPPHRSHPLEANSRSSISPQDHFQAL